MSKKSKAPRVIERVTDSMTIAVWSKRRARTEPSGITADVSMAIAALLKVG
jgi:hypothetical protein